MLIDIAVGTRPEVIKMAPIIHELRARAGLRVRVIATAQHRQLLDDMLEFFQITPDFDFNLMKNNQNLAQLSAEILHHSAKIWAVEQPNWVLVQGDTTTALCVALSAFYHKIKIGHVEAGLRTFTINNPYPEEANRQLISKIANVHFAPTASAKRNLLRERVAKNTIFITGNSVIDALVYTLNQSPKTNKPEPQKMPRGQVLITVHRRENFNDNLLTICQAIRKIADDYPQLDFIWSRHPNPNIQNIVNDNMNNLPNLLVRDPLPYPEFTRQLRDCLAVISDSGGVQEEASFLGKPILILRDSTERPEVVKCGIGTLVGHDGTKIINEFARIIANPIRGKSTIFGKGKCAAMIADIVLGNENM